MLFARGGRKGACADCRGHGQVAGWEDKILIAIRSALYQKWGVGEKKTDHGVLILLAIQDRKRSIHVGYGLEPILPDGKVGGFGREAVPLLQSGDYDGAVTLLTTRVASVIAADAGDHPGESAFHGGTATATRPRWRTARPAHFLYHRYCYFHSAGDISRRRRAGARWIRILVRIALGHAV